MRAIHTHHVEVWRDPWLANTWRHPWYFSICAWEATCHVPFYFVAAYAYYHGPLGHLNLLQTPSAVKTDKNAGARSAAMVRG
ncbi:hypothetical protein BaRGS_00035309, partial [Batillaria attramentaria]